MNLNDKFAGIPTFYYFNSDSNTPLNDHMERNLINLKVKNYQRVVEQVVPTGQNERPGWFWWQCQHAGVQ